MGSLVLSYFLIGAAIGAITGIPIGPVNVAVIDTAYRHHLRRAIAVGLGGALADMTYAFLGIVGLGPLLLEYPAVPPVLFSISGVVLMTYGVLTIRAQPVDPTEKLAEGAGQSGYFWSGFGLGVALIFLNPAAIITWVVIVGSTLAVEDTVQGTAAALGVGVGSFAWFSFVAYLSDHGKRLLGKNAIWITRIVGILLLGYGGYCIFRAARYYLT